MAASMLGYYLRLGRHALLRTPVLSALMVLALGLGIGASMTMLTVVHVMSGDPLPERSSRLYTPHLDPLPRSYRDNPFAGRSASDNLTYPDAMALLDAHRAARQAAMAGLGLLVWPDSGVHPFREGGRAVTPDFFAMFALRFVDGAAWSADDEARNAHVVVLSADLNQRLFGSEHGAGRNVRLGNVVYRVVGVVQHWQPEPMFYADSGSDAFVQGDRYFIPLHTAISVDADFRGRQVAWASGSGLTSQSITWLQFWVQLDSATQAQSYLQYLRDYSDQQRRLGVYERPAQNAALYSLMDWLHLKHAVPSDLRLQTGLALAFLIICIFNIVALLLARFLRRSGEISVRRALGAKRGDIFGQLCVEALVLGLAGGVLGLALAQLGLWQVRRQPDSYAHLAQMDLAMLAASFTLAVFASLLAAVIPAWRASRLTPALHPKTQ